MNLNSWFKKEKPFLSLQSMGGGAAGLMISAGTPEPIEATGGTKSTPGDGYIYHVFTSSGSLSVTQGKGSEYNFLVVGGAPHGNCTPDTCVVAAVPMTGPNVSHDSPHTERHRDESSPALSQQLAPVASPRRCPRHGVTKSPSREPLP